MSDEADDKVAEFASLMDEVAANEKSGASEEGRRRSLDADEPHRLIDDWRAENLAVTTAPGYPPVQEG
jgi:hypothetical protein